ncbi:MAG: glutamine--fructose-6-phosphate transaminase (isomerizing) [Clostridiales bacterium]|nr:glutamine--fructose-6-phosphate transaminase (isomerizing) [Clostridiales bacterium]MCF8022451.1 glutamine--fructose-6-phosphate transaminase (isomerizing) [Clostridiales bacterium]
MCGIVGYIGEQCAVPILLEGLAKLEYRGYDSAGIAVLDDGTVEVKKQKGKLNNLVNSMNGFYKEAVSGIGHTRWATHGRPNNENAHPHTDCTGKIAVVHNGIIENYMELREWLISRGHSFKSETDTEVLPHLIEELYQGDLVDTLQQVISKVEGSYAMVAMNAENSGELAAARHDSPLIIGLGEGENFLASDIPAILKHTRNTYILEDGEVARITPREVNISDSQGRPVLKEVFKVQWEQGQAEKNGYPHFMLKEIYEQPRAIRDTLAGRVSLDEGKVTLKEIKLDEEKVSQIDKIYITACGTAYHAGMVGKSIIESLARVPVEVDIASELRYRDVMMNENTLVIVISQSGETADTLASLREANRVGARTLAVTNVVDSSIAREAGDVLYTWAGPEIAVASTKAYTTQLVAMYLLGLYLAQKRETIDRGEAVEIINNLRELSTKVETTLQNGEKIKQFAEQYSNSTSSFFIGRGLDYAVALEGALKLKEISYMHAEAYAAGELKHGTLSLIVEGVPVVALATQQHVYDKMISNIKEVKARDATVLALAPEGFTGIEQVVDEAVFIPEAHPVIAPVLTVVPLQMLAYYMALQRGCDVDQPRNLAKSVTVE